jgi:hypothetical protein
MLDRAPPLRGAHELDALQLVERAHVVAHVRQALVDHPCDLVWAGYAVVEDREDVRAHRMRERLCEPCVDQTSLFLGHV